MTTSEIVSLCSLAVFSLSLTLSIWSFVFNLRSSRVSQTERLHEVWWSKDMMETRDEVFAMCKNLSKEDSMIRSFAAYYHSPLTTNEPAGRASFAKLVGFFGNLEICLSASVLDEKLTCRLFGEAHYADYQPFISRVRDAILRDCPQGKGLPQWLQMTLDLERRFIRQGVRFDRSHLA